ncbi:nucleoside hydrolase [Paenibacillaceae bacterium WGS1546]|uniref:nucleoside hydrolase n=1 Tax=Cohnella sp. WGS1546 TaxID=3366810 RepID=UPI00372D6A35
MNKIIIDTDPGDDIDDILAIAFGLKRPELDVKAITTVTYGARRRADIVRGLLETMDKTHIPVGSGMELPLRTYTKAEYAAMTDNGGYVLNHYSPTMSRPDPCPDAVELLIDTVRRHPNELGIVTLGPMTNIAVALRKDPSIASRIKWIASMGGELNVYRAEHNVTWDSVSAEIVLASGIPLFLGTWDVTRQVVVTEEDCERIKRQPSRMCRYLSECIDMWRPYKKMKPGPVMFDLAPVIWSFNKELYRTRPMTLQIENAGRLTRGVTVPVPDPQDGDALVDVSVAVDAERVKAMFMASVCSE